MSPSRINRSRQFGYLLFWVLAAWALFSVGLNQFLRDIDQRIPWFEQLVETRSEFSLGISHIKGYWTGFALILEIDDLVLSSQQDTEGGLKLEKVAIEVDLLKSLLSLSPGIDKLLVRGLSLELEQDALTGKLNVKGLPVRQQQDNTLDMIESILDRHVFSIDKVYLENVVVELALKDGKHVTATVERAMLDNEWFNHQLNVRASVMDFYNETRNIELHALFHGNPLRPERFSSRFYLGMEESEWQPWLQQLEFGEKISLRLLQGKMAARFWGEIKNGTLKSVSFAPKLSGFSFSNADGSFQDTLNRLSLIVEINTEIELKHVLDKSLLLEAVKNNTSIKLSNFVLDWKEQIHRDILLLSALQWSEKQPNPLAKKWSQLNPQSTAEPVLLFRLMLNHLPLNLLENIKPVLNGVLPQFADKLKLIDGLVLEGKLNNIQLIIYSPDKESREIFASVDVKNLGLSEFNRIPAIRGVDAYLEYAPKVLALELESKNVLLEQSEHLFRGDVFIKEASANLLVEFLPHDIVVHSNYARLRNDTFDVTAQFAANVPNRYYADGSREIPAWSLHVAVNSVEVNQVKIFFLEKLPPAFLDWIDTFLVEGEVEGDLMLFAFAKKVLPHTFLTLSANLELKRAALDPLPNRWPPLEKVYASVVVHDDYISADVPSANLYQSTLKNGKVEIPSYLNENLPRVAIQADVTGPLANVQTLFLNSELKDSIGHVIEDWVLVGDYQAHLDINVPLAEVEGQPPSEVNIQMQVEDVILAVPEVGLGVKSLSTELLYSLDKGLQSSEISALFFDKPVRARILTSEVGGEQVIQVFGKGRIAAQDLKGWQSFWLFNALQGETDFDGIISIAPLKALNALVPELTEVPGETLASSNELAMALNLPLVGDESVVRLNVGTSFRGFAIDLPGEYAKTENTAAPSTLQLDVYPDNLIYRMNYNNEVGVSARTVNDDFDRAHIHFGSGDFQLPAAPGLIVTGIIYQLDFDEWQTYLETYLLDDAVEKNTSHNTPDARKLAKFSDSSFQDLLSEDKNDTAQPDASGKERKQETPDEDEFDFIKLIDVLVDEFSGFGQHIHAIKAQVTRESYKWKLVLDSRLVKGDVWVPDPENINRHNPIIAKLKHLDLDELESSEPVEKNAQASAAAESEVYKPEDFVDVKVDITRVTLDKTKYANWRFEFYPDEHGMDFKVHQLNYGLMTINGEGRWDYSEEKSITHFNGRVRTTAMSNIFGALNLKPSAQTGGLMAIKVSWPGSPMDFDPDNMKGKAGLKIFDGSIVEVDIKSKKFKALGIFNLGFLTDIVTFRVFKKIGKGIEDAFSSSESKEHEAE